jgi:hypothetical protein
MKTEHSVIVNSVDELRTAAIKLFSELGDINVIIADRHYSLSYILKMTDTALSALRYPATVTPIFFTPDTTQRGLGNGRPHGWLGDVASKQA